MIKIINHLPNNYKEWNNQEVFKLQKITNLSIAVVRAFLEISVVAVGWYLGGTVGIGTLLFAFGIGPAVALGLFLVDKVFN